MTTAVPAEPYTLLLFFELEDPEVLWLLPASGFVGSSTSVVALIRACRVLYALTISSEDASAFATTAFAVWIAAFNAA